MARIPDGRRAGQVPQTRGGATRHGTPAIKQHTPNRHYTLATIGLYTYVTRDGEYFNNPYFVEQRDFKWAAANKLIERDPSLTAIVGRNWRTWAISLTADGKRVLAAWNTKHGKVDTPEGL